jgi:uncharacterized protein (TIGR02453 family)
VTLFTQNTFGLLSELTQNNTKEWFADNKASYEQSVREPFAEMLTELTVQLSSTEVPFVGSEKTMFRAHRDVRFSQDKSPYNTHVSGLLTPSGTKSEAQVLIYFHLDAGGGFIVSGLYHPSTDRLETLRQSMIEKPEQFIGVVDELSKYKLSLDESEATKNMPRSFTEHSESPVAQYVKLKNLMVRKEMTQQDWLDQNLIENLKTFALQSTPLIRFLEEN